ncbi:MAG: 3-phosphoshikimate 1-carboxyvinyltransferase [Acidobacteriia bacterium]|nr:3-phosphoshikimate 1-carboxyvinyltransferase [Terriglobia bacterium]
MTDIVIHPAQKIHGEVSVPGDKSISHRLALLAALADGVSTFRNFSTSRDCQSTLKCLRALGVQCRRIDSETLQLKGRGLGGLHSPRQTLDAGNSGSTIRMLSGILAGHEFVSKITGDESLRRRPMLRIMEPLSRMGARLEGREKQFPPLKIHGAKLHGISYCPPVASAQVKTAVLLAGTLAEGVTEVLETIPTRNHTEVALREFGAEIEIAGSSIRISGGRRLHAGSFTVPGDPSGAAFWVAAAILAPHAALSIHSVGLNSTRTQFFDLLKSMGADLVCTRTSESGGEPVGNIFVRSSELKGGSLDPHLIPSLIDEIPILAILGARSRLGLVVRGAQELRFKESDRILAVASNLKALGVDVEESPDGFTVKGRQKFSGGAVDSFGDHRIAMAFAIAGLVAEGPIKVRNAGCVRISYPNFFPTLKGLAGK